MNIGGQSHRLPAAFPAALLGLALTILPGGCTTPSTLGAIGVGAGAHSPNNEIEQIYYVGSFDPREQLPPEVYRIKVHGQASAFSNTRFASGWVKAAVIDSLGGSVGFGDQGKVATSQPEGDFGALPTGRRLMLFGPEGFREAPTDHRLVIIMGANPEDFFNAIDQSLGAVAEVQQEQLDSGLSNQIFGELLRLQAEANGLDQLERSLNATQGASS